MNRMFSFSSSILPKALENKQGNPQQPSASKEKIQRYYSDFSMENSNEIETPQFKDFRSHQPTESLFDSYHHQFSQKNNQLTNLISTCQKLGLDVEYLEDSDGESFPQTPKELKIPLKLQSIPQKQSYEQLDDSLRYISSRNHHEKFEGIKENCQVLKITLNETKMFAKECQEGMKALCLDFSTMLAQVSQKFQRNFLELRAENQSLRLELSTSHSENKILDSKLNSLEGSIRSLTRQKDEGDEENRKLHQQMQKLHKKLAQMITRKAQSEQLRSQLTKLQQRNSEYQNYLSQLQQKIDTLEYRLKESKRDYQILSHEHRGTRRQLQGQYRKLFERSLKEITHKIEVQTYHRIKQDEQSRHYYEPSPKIHQSTFLTPARPNNKASLSGSYSSARLLGQTASKDFIRNYNLQSTSGGQLQAQQRKVQNILDDIKRMGPVTRSNRPGSRKGY